MHCLALWLGVRLLASWWKIFDIFQTCGRDNTTSSKIRLRQRIWRRACIAIIVLELLILAGFNRNPFAVNRYVELNHRRYILSHLTVNFSAYSNVFGLEPYYPYVSWYRSMHSLSTRAVCVRRCCTVNHPQGYPKFITNSFVTNGDKTLLVQTYLGPLTASTTLAGGACLRII